MTRAPKFAESVTNIMASESNPQRVGLFVRVVRRNGRVMNPGTWWELTDGKGSFWQVNPTNCVTWREDDAMTLPEKLVTATVSALHDQFFCGCEWGGASGAARHHPADSAEWAKAAHIAVAAVLRALPENVVPAVWAHRMPSGNFHRFHGKDSVHMDGCIPLYDLAAIAKLADDA